jgi:hypothetical protein
MQSPDLMDEVLAFGDLTLGLGRAYASVSSSNLASTVTGKEFKTIEGRQFLVESVDFPSISAAFDAMSRTTRGAKNSFPRAGKHWRFASVPPRIKSPPRAASSRGGLQAGIRHAQKPRGVVIDYFMTLGGSLSGSRVFQSDTTYFISGPTYVSSSATIEGGVVFKYPATSGTGATNAFLQLQGPIILKTSDFAPATFTAADDTSIGAWIGTGTWPGYTGIPDGKYYGSAALWVFSPPPLKHLHFHYCEQAISYDFFGGDAPTVKHSQFLNCLVGIHIDAGSGETISLQNCLFANVAQITEDLTGAAFENTWSFLNCTISEAAGLFADTPGGASFGNCVLANMEDVSAYTVSGSALYNAGGYSSIPDYPFTSAGAASYYLSGYGWTTGDPLDPDFYSDFAAELAGRTIRPPIVVSNQTITTDLLLQPQAERNLSGQSIGYNYPAIDYLFHESVISNATVSVLPGTSIAGGGSFGLYLKPGGVLNCSGTPTRMNHIVRYNVAQELSDTNWSAVGDLIRANETSGGAASEANFYFTEFSVPVDQSADFACYGGPSYAVFRHCRFQGGGLVQQGSGGIAITNSIFERSVNFYEDDGTSFALCLQNCFIFGSEADLYRTGSGTWVFRDNIFDGVTIDQSGTLDHAYNGYTSSGYRLTPTNSHDIVSTVAYQSGPLGDWYQPSTSSFIDQGSTTAAAVGLYHFTVKTNLVSGLQVKEGSGTVDIGAHYVAVTSAGKEIDTDGDQIADIFEDFSGNGSTGGTETNWQISENGTTGVPGLVVFTFLE